MRNLREYVDQMSIDPSRQNNIKNAEGGVVLEYTSTAVSWWGGGGFGMILIEI